MKNLQVLALDKKMDASVRTVNAIHRLLMDRNSLTAVSPSPPILSRSATPQLSPTSSVQYLDRWFFRANQFTSFFKQWRFLKSEYDTGIDCFFRKVQNLTYNFLFVCLMITDLNFNALYQVAFHETIVELYQRCFLPGFQNQPIQI